jgi:predicted homoserine dehydrogenase-like protein
MVQRTWKEGQSSNEGVRIGVVGSGFVCRSFLRAVERHGGFGVSSVLTRRDPRKCKDFTRQDLLTASVNELLDNSDVILECTGDAIYATSLIDRVLANGLPVVTMNSEFHVTAGSYFVDKGLVTESEGDQPGCQAALKEEVEELGFTPLIYGNMKGFLNHAPSRDEMVYWAKRNGISLPMNVSFTDGTKVQIEQALVANGFGATIAAPGLLGLKSYDLDAVAAAMMERVRDIGEPISDYILSPKLPHGVFIVATHDDEEKGCLSYYKLGGGPYYVLQKPHIFVHLEIMKTIKRVVGQKRALLNNSKRPRVSVATVAKHDLKPGDRIDQGIGSFDVRGIAVRIAENIGHVPIGLMQNAVVKRRLATGDLLSFDDVEIPESLALKAWREIEAGVTHRERVA